MGIEHTFLSSTFVLLKAFFRIKVEHIDPQEGLEKAETDPEEGLEKAETSTPKSMAVAIGPVSTGPLFEGKLMNIQ